MIINLLPGDELVVQFAETDGEVRVHFDSKIYPNAIVVEETADLPDDMGRRGVLYRETFKAADIDYPCNEVES